MNNPPLKPILSNTYRTLLLCVSLVAASIGAKADLINVNFSPNGTSVAGVYGSSGQTWTALNSDSNQGYTYNYTTGGLADASGTGTSVTLTFIGDAYNGYNYDGGETFDTSLFGRLLYTHGTDETIDYSNLTAGNYDLIVFSDNSAGSNITFDANGVSETLTPVQDNSGFSPSPGNYLSVDVVVTSNGKLNLTNIDTGSQGISGLQLEALPASVPEPSVLGMVVGGGLLLVFFVRRKLAANS